MRHFLLTLGRQRVLTPLGSHIVPPIDVAPQFIDINKWIVKQ